MSGKHKQSVLIQYGYLVKDNLVFRGNHFLNCLYRNLKLNYVSEFTPIFEDDLLPYESS